jgi:hypothetical protein
LMHLSFNEWKYHQKHPARVTRLELLKYVKINTLFIPIIAEKHFIDHWRHVQYDQTISQRIKQLFCHPKCKFASIEPLSESQITDSNALLCHERMWNNKSLAWQTKKNA